VNRTKVLQAFGFKREPFSKEVEDNELWQPESKREQLETVIDALYRRQHVLIEGEPGAGKTVLLRAIRHALPQTRFTMTYCHNATLGKRDFYRLLCTGIGLSCRATAASMFQALTEYVEGLATEHKQHPVFLLDEAHLMKDDMLDNLHILQNYSWDSKALLSLVLIGLPELTQRLNRRRHRSLMSRIPCRVAVGPLVPDDTAEYLRYRLQQAGCTKEIFPPDSVALLHEKTGGLMRDIDRIASLALALAYRKRTQIIHKDIILDAISVETNGGLT
jgi:type II secretory pathway predicted ATPase ExeA